MGKTKDLTQVKVNQIEFLSCEKLSQREMASHCNVSKSSVLRVQRNMASRTSYTIHLTDGEDVERDERQRRKMIGSWCVLYDRRDSSRRLSYEADWRSVNVTSRTVQRRLHEMDCHAVRPRKVPQLTQRMKIKRLDFACRHANWTVEDWRRVAFSDESSFECQKATRQRIWQPSGSPAPVCQRVKHPTKIMMWGMFSYKGTGRLHVCESTMNSASYLQVLQTRMLPHFREWFPENDGVFMQDGAPCHTARVVKRYLDGINVPLLEWPENSPDLKPIVKRRLAAKTVTTKQQLIAEIIKIWHHDADMNEKLQALVDSMPRRIAKVIEAKGGHTKY